MLVPGWLRGVHCVWRPLALARGGCDDLGRRFTFAGEEKEGKDHVEAGNQEEKSQPSVHREVS